jgi:hypothetical protein
LISPNRHAIIDMSKGDKMKNVLISVHTKSWTVANQFAVRPDRPVGTVVVDTYAIISHNGREPREYKVSPHDNCEGEGYIYLTMESWSDDAHCTGCDYYKYYGMGD